jgi:hypothetical protein
MINVGKSCMFNNQYGDTHFHILCSNSLILPGIIQLSIYIHRRRGFWINRIQDGALETVCVSACEQFQPGNISSASHQRV